MELSFQKEEFSPSVQPVYSPILPYPPVSSGFMIFLWVSYLPLPVQPFEFPLLPSAFPPLCLLPVITYYNFENKVAKVEMFSEGINFIVMCILS